jgi:hypothetical protein
MEYAHGNLLQIEKGSQLLQELLEDYPYLDSQHVSPELIKIFFSHSTISPNTTYSKTI